MLMNTTIQIGDQYHDNSNQQNYSIVFASQAFVILCLQQKKYTKLVLVQIPTVQFYTMIDNKEFSKVDNKKDVVIDEDSLTEIAKKNYQINHEIINAVNKEYGPTYLGLLGHSKKPLLDSLCKQYRITRPKLWRIINKYLQSGCQLSALLETRGKNKERKLNSLPPGKKPNGKRTAKIITKQDIANMDEAIANIKSTKSKVATKKDAYVEMLDNHYSKIITHEDGSISRELNPIGSYPNQQQFYRYLRKNMPAADYEIAKTSKREYRNNHRALTGTERAGLSYPGELCDIDATPVDIYLVSKGKTWKLVNRAHLYLIIDVLTGLIISGNISFEDNSDAAVTNVLMNLKRAGRNRLLSKAGYNLEDEAFWPADILPGTLRCDRGSEFTSKEFRRKCNELGINIQLVTAASGSLKGSIEKEFNQFNISMGDTFEHAGRITKRIDADYKETAKLNIDDMRKIMISYIMYHNERVIENRLPSKEMVERHIKPSPIELWKLHSEKNSPHFITMSNDQFIWSIMKPANASMTKQGIKFKGLHYINELDNYLIKFMKNTLSNTSEKMKIRYDEASMGHIFYLRENKMFEAEINPLYPEDLTYKDTSYKMFTELMKAATDMKKEGKHNNIQALIEHTERLEAIKDKRENTPVPESTNKIRENTKVEKELDNRENKVSDLLENVVKSDADDGNGDYTNETLKGNNDNTETVKTENEDDENKYAIDEDDEEKFKEAFFKKYGL